MNIFRGATRRVVMLSSIDVYRASRFRRAGQWSAAGATAYGRVGAAPQVHPLPSREHAAHAKIFPGDGRLRQVSGGARRYERPRTFRHGAATAMCMDPGIGCIVFIPW